MYQVLLKREEWEVYFNSSTRFVNTLRLPTYTVSMMLGEYIRSLQEEGGDSQYYRITKWITEYNNKLSKIDFNYAYVSKYYELLGEDDAFVESDYAKKNYNYWFSYEVESLLYRMFGLEDCLYHIIVEKFDLNVSNTAGFKNKVVTQMKKQNSQFGEYLYELKKKKDEDYIDKDLRYINANKLRNSFTHNHSPLNPELNQKMMETKNDINFIKPTYIYENPIDVIKAIEKFAEYIQEFLVEFKKNIY